jgi:hypothetical protein
MLADGIMGRAVVHQFAAVVLGSPTAVAGIERVAALWFARLSLLILLNMVFTCK